jgi:hypothetical protein
MTLVTFPAGPHPPPAQIDIAIERLVIGAAADWQKSVLAECKRQRTLTPAIPGYLKETGSLNHCTFLASTDSVSSLLFIHLGYSTLAVLGRAWGRAVLKRPQEADPHSELARCIGVQYAEAIEGGQALVNRISVTGLGRPFVYTQALYGWSHSRRRAVLSCVDVQGLDRLVSRPSRFQ